MGGASNFVFSRVEEEGKGGSRGREKRYFGDWRATTRGEEGSNFGGYCVDRYHVGVLGV